MQASRKNTGARKAAVPRKGERGEKSLKKLWISRRGELFRSKLEVNQIGEIKLNQGTSRR